MKAVDCSEVGRLVHVPDFGRRAELTSIIADAGAILRGHFALQGGRHSKYLLRFRAIGRNRDIAHRVADMLIPGCPQDLKNPTVICPESAGFFLGAAVAERLGASLTIARLDELRHPAHTLRTGVLERDSEAVVVNDVTTTGASVQTLIDIAQQHGVPVRAVLVFATLDDLQFKRFLDDRRLTGGGLVRCTWQSHEKDLCPLCRDGQERLLPAAEFN